jgi:hypothetical protein
MRFYQPHCRLIVLLGAWAFSPGRISAQHPPEPRSLLRSISRLGADSVVQNLESKPAAWNAVLHGISLGDSLWLEVYWRLLPNNSAHGSEELDEAVIQALPLAPARVLRLAARGGRAPADAAAGVCGQEFETKDLAGYIHRSKEAVTPLLSATSADLRSLAAACLARFQKLDSALRDTMPSN